MKNSFKTKSWDSPHVRLNRNKSCALISANGFDKSAKRVDFVTIPSVFALSASVTYAVYAETVIKIIPEDCKLAGNTGASGTVIFTVASSQRFPTATGTTVSGGLALSVLFVVACLMIYLKKRSAGQKT